MCREGLTPGPMLASKHVPKVVVFTEYNLLLFEKIYFPTETSLTTSISPLKLYH